MIEVIEDVKKVTEERHFYSKNHAKLTYFHLIFPSFQYYAALIYTWNPIYVEYISAVINKADALPTN